MNQCSEMGVSRETTQPGELRVSRETGQFGELYRSTIGILPFGAMQLESPPARVRL
jgi:hypothetical protein